MTRIASVCLILAFSSLYAATPDFQWVAAGGGLKNDKTRAVAFDREGNVLLAGETTDDGSFGGLKRAGHGGMDFFVAKVTLDGRFAWMRSLGGSLVDRGYGVVADAQGSIYVTGHFQSTDAVVDGKPLPNAGDYDVFLAKYDGEGTLQWLRTAGGKGYDYGHGIAIDPAGDVVVTGAVAGEARFGDVTVNAGGKSRPIFIAKYDTSGTLKWSRTTEGTFSGSGHGIGVDGGGNIYVGGSGGGTGHIGKVELKTEKVQAGVVIKLTGGGDAVWAALMPGSPSAGFHEIAVDRDGRVWCAGMFKGSITLGDSKASTTSEKDNDGVLAHYGADGVLRWARVIQGPATDYCLGVTTDHSGRCFVTGEFSQTAIFAGKTLVSKGATDIQVAALDAKGEFEWLLSCGAEKGDNAYTMAWHPSGKLVIAGSCAAPAAFGSQTMRSPGGAEAYGAVLRLPAAK